jgi:hypothetical protein
LWGPKVRPGGCVALHDVWNRKWPGVGRALSRLLWRSTTVADVRFTDSIAVVKTVARNTFRERLRNRCLAVYLRVYRNLPTLPRPLRAVARKLVFRS